MTNLQVDLVHMDQVTGNLITLLLLRAIQGERSIVVADGENHRIQVLIEMASSCLSLGQWEREMASLVVQRE